MDQEIPSDKFERLRRQAEELIRQKPGVSDEPPDDMLSLIHELKIHQAELEIQNQELQRSQEEIEKLHREYADLYEFAPCGYITLDAKGIISRANLTAVKLLGVERRIILKSTFSRLLDKEGMDRFLAARKAAERTGEDERIELPLNKGSDSLWIRVNIRADRDASEALVQWRMVLFDISERKRLEEALNRLNAVLEQKVAQRTELAETRAAQLQSLTVEVIEAEERERTRISRLLHDDLQQMLASAKLRLNNVGNGSSADPAIAEVSAILQESIAKSRTLSHELCPPVLGSGGLIGALEWLVRRMEQQFGLQVELELKTEESISEPLRMFLFRAVQEFLFNVNRHAGTKTARIRLLRSDGNVTVIVSDQGQGFDPEAFGSEAKPSGIGLMSIRERARYLGGSLEIETAPGEGSRFTLKVPFKLKETQSRKQKEWAIGHYSGSGEKDCEPADKGDKRVILVDDHDVMRQGLIDLIKNQKGIEVVGEAANGREAIEQAREHRPDVILMDVSMPVIDGIEATRRIKMEMPRVRVIGLSMHEDEHTASTLRKAGAEALITKSVSLPELCKAIHGRIDEQ